MTPMVQENERKNGVELHFRAKPSVLIRDAMKAAGFRWSPQVGYWFAPRSYSTLKLAYTLAGATDAEARASEYAESSAIAGMLEAQGII